MSRKVYGGRHLLNLPGHHGTAAIVAEIENTENADRFQSDDYDGYDISPRATCKITDCDGSVSIQIDVDSANELENSLHKIDVIVDALLAMRPGLIAEHHRVQDRLDRHPDPSNLYAVKHAVSKRSPIQLED